MSTVYVILVLYPILWKFGTCTPAEDACPLGLHQQETLRVFGDKCYKFALSSYVDYDGAKMYCEGQGGHLASIGDEQTQSFMTTTARKLNNYEGSKMWIGLSDFSVKGELSWADGTDMTYSNFDTKNKQASPLSLSDVTTAYRHCVAMDTTSGLWYHYKCGSFNAFSMRQLFPYVCQFSSGRADTRPTPPSFDD